MADQGDTNRWAHWPATCDNKSPFYGRLIKAVHQSSLAVYQYSSPYLAMGVVRFNSLRLIQSTLKLGFSRNKRKRQPIEMLGGSSGNHDWLFVNASACVSCGFRIRNARNASDCVWMETGLKSLTAPMHMQTHSFIIACHSKLQFSAKVSKRTYQLTWLRLIRIVWMPTCVWFKSTATVCSQLKNPYFIVTK